MVFYKPVVRSWAWDHWPKIPQSGTVASNHAQSIYQGMLSFLLHCIILQTRISEFLACIKILSALTWLQRVGMKASMRAIASSEWVEKIASRSAGKVCGLSERGILSDTHCRSKVSSTCGVLFSQLNVQFSFKMVWKGGVIYSAMIGRAYHDNLFGNLCVVN